MAATNLAESAAESAAAAGNAGANDNNDDAAANTSLVSTASAAFRAAHATLDAAEEKLRHAAEFSSGAAEPLNALGEALQARADLLRSAARAEAGLGTGLTLGFNVTAGDIDAPLSRALAPEGGGFGSALRLDANNADALVGAGFWSSTRSFVRARFFPGSTRLDTVRVISEVYACSTRSDVGRER